MGVRTDPGYELFADDCLACFDAGETPKKIFAYFGGIEFTAAGKAAGLPSIRRTWILEQWDGIPCLWWAGNPLEWICYYSVNDDGDSYIFLKYSVWSIFVSDVPGTCHSAFANQNIDGAPWVGAVLGRAQVFWRPYTNSPSIKGIMNKLNIVPHRNTMFEGFPLDATHAVAKYCRTKDATNIKIKFEI